MKLVTNTEYTDPFVYFNGITVGNNWTYENPAVYDPSVGYIMQSQAFYGFYSPSQYFILSVLGNVNYAMYSMNGVHAKVYIYDYLNHSRDNIENLTHSMLLGELNDTSTTLIRVEHPMVLLAVITPISNDYDSIGSPIQITFSNQPNEVNPEPHYIIDWGNRIDGSCWNVAGKVYTSKFLGDMSRKYVPDYQKIPILTLGIYKKIILSDIEVTGSTDFTEAFGNDESYDDYDVVQNMSFDYRYSNASVPEWLRHQSFMCKMVTSFYANDSGDYHFNISQCDKSYVILNGQSIFFEQGDCFISNVKQGYNDLTIYCNYSHSVDTSNEEYSKAYFDFYPYFSTTYYIPNDWNYDKQLTISGILEGTTVQRLYTGEDTLVESDQSVPVSFTACSDGITIGMDVMLLEEESSSSSELESSSSGDDNSSSSLSEESSSGSEESSSSSEESSGSSEESSSSLEGDDAYDSYDVTTSGITLYDQNVDTTDYQYNTDGLNAVVLPIGYKSISGTKDSIRLVDFIYGTYGIAINDNGNLLTQNPSDGEYCVYGEDADWTVVSGFYTNYNYNENAYAIKAGALYYIAYDEYNGLIIDRIGSDNDWTAISGYSTTGSTNYCWAFGIRDGKLYSLKGSIATQLGEATNWMAVTGFAYYEDIENGYKMSIAYGVAGGSLYKIYVSDYLLVVEQVGLDTDWQQVSGYGYLKYYTGGDYYEQDSSTGGDYYEQDSSGAAFGIRGGMLFELNNLTRIDLTMDSWHFVVMVEPNEAVALAGSSGSSSSSSSVEPSSGSSSSSESEESSSSATNHFPTLLFHGRGIVIRRTGRNTITIETANDYQMASFNVLCGKWIGIFITFDSNVTTWFVDRNADAINISNTHATSSEPFYMGFSESDEGIGYLGGSDRHGDKFHVKNVIAINKLLKQNEINRLYNARA